MRLLLALACLLALPAFAELDRPVIGVAGGGPSSMSVRYSMAALWDAGAYPVLLDTRQPANAARDLRGLNGLIVAGNSLDINPADYGANAHPKTKDEDTFAEDDWERYRDDYEYAVIEHAIEANLPFLGICGGMQRLNVSAHTRDGGTLGQHIDGQAIWDKNQLPHMPSLPVTLVKQSHLARIAAAERFGENSLHHQHIAELRKGFRAAAHDATSGIIEAIETDPQGRFAAHPFAFGVQWHPEYGASTASKRLMRAFVDSAKAHAAQYPVAMKEVYAIDVSPGWLRGLVRKGVRGMRETVGYKFPEWANHY